MTAAFDPYDILGVPQSATPSEIKSAYRRRARETHPDISKATDADAFQSVVRAYGVLSDPAKRKRFDETGDFEEIDHVAERKAAMSVLVDMFERVIERAASESFNLASINIVAKLRELISKNIDDANDQMRSLDYQIDERLSLRRRITRKGDGENLFATRLTKHVDALGNAREEQAQRLRVLNIIETELGNYDNEVELVFAFQSERWGAADSTSTDAGWTLRKTW